MLTPSQLLRAHPIERTPCSPQPKNSVLEFRLHSTGLQETTSECFWWHAPSPCRNCSESWDILPIGMNWKDRTQRRMLARPLPSLSSLPRPFLILTSKVLFLTVGTTMCIFRKTNRIFCVRVGPPIGCMTNGAAWELDTKSRGADSAMSQEQTGTAAFVAAGSLDSGQQAASSPATRTRSAPTGALMMTETGNASRPPPTSACMRGASP